MWIRADRNDPLPPPKRKHGFLRKLDRLIEYATDVPFTKTEAALAEIFLQGLLDLVDRAYDRDNKRIARRKEREAAKTR